MSKYSCSYYLTEGGKSPVEDFVKSLNPRTRQKFFNVVNLLETFGKQLPEPHAKNIGDNIFELRVRGQDGHLRFLYFFYDKSEIVFTHGFKKETNKIPKKEKDTAIKRKQIYLERLKK